MLSQAHLSLKRALIGVGRGILHLRLHSTVCGRGSSVLQEEKGAFLHPSMRRGRHAASPPPTRGTFPRRAPFLETGSDPWSLTWMLAKQMSAEFPHGRCWR